MEHGHLCMGCMTDRGTAPHCPACGYVDGTPPGSPDALPPRTLLNGRYLAGRTLGQGGFGITYIGWDTVLQTRVAIKEHFPDGLASRDADHAVTARSRGAREELAAGLERFLAEARVLGKFQDELGIVQVRDFFSANGTGYLVMSYLDGKTFKEYLAEHGGRIPFGSARELFLPVIDALRKVHDAGLLHRDISPDNLFITYAGQVRLLDFGAAKAVTGERSRSASAVFKPGYTPFEQYMERPDLGPWTDVYAMAATIYRAITGQVPPAAPDRHADDALAPPSALGVELPARAERALMKGLAIRAADRHRTLAEFQAELFADDPVAPGRRRGRLDALLDAVLRHPLARNRAVPIGLAIAVLLSFAALLGGRDPRPRIVRIEFPTDVVAGRSYSGRIVFEDADGDVVRVNRYSVEGGYERGEWSPDVKGRTGGEIGFSLRTSRPEKIRLRFTLTDDRQNVSEPAELSFEIKPAPSPVQPPPVQPPPVQPPPVQPPSTRPSPPPAPPTVPPSAAQAIAAQIRGIRIEHQVVRNGRRGFDVHVRFEIRNARGRGGIGAVRVLDAAGNPVRAAGRDARYRDRDGLLVARIDFRPAFDNATYPGADRPFAIFVPYDELPPGLGPTVAVKALVGVDGRVVSNEFVDRTVLPR